MRIIVLGGGVGPEREVSLESGRNVAEALQGRGHDVRLRDISPKDHSSLSEPADLFFVALHGEFGEDGTVQRVLEDRGLRYTFSGPAASELAFDKLRSKRHMLRLGMATPPYRVIERGDPMDQWEAPTYPAIVKPICSGSSVDVFPIASRRELVEKADEVLSRHERVLVESYVEGPELTVGIVGRVVLPICQIAAAQGFYDYRAKYLTDATQYLFDIDLPEALLKRVREQSLALHDGLGCEVLSRVDWRVDRASNTAYALEINTIPGFTSHSLVPKAARRIGLSFEDLCERVVELSLALPRHATQEAGGFRASHAA